MRGPRGLAAWRATPGGLARPGGALASALLVLLAGVAVAAAVQGGMAGASGERIVVLLLVAPLIEEALFRAGLHEALLRRAAPPALANVATALAFGITHVLLRGDLAAFAVMLPALLIGAVYQRARRVRHCVLLHAAMNAAWLAAGLAGLPLAA